MLLGFHPVTVVGGLAQKMGKRQHKTIENKNTKQETNIRRIL